MSEHLPNCAHVRAQQYRRVPQRRSARPMPSVRGAARALAGDRHRSIERRWDDWPNRQIPSADGRRKARQWFVDGSPPGPSKRACGDWREGVGVRRRAARGRSEFGPAAGQSPPNGNVRSAQRAHWSRRRPSVHARSDRRTAASYRQCYLSAGVTSSVWTRPERCADARQRRATPQNVGHRARTESLQPSRRTDRAGVGFDNGALSAQ